MAVFSMETAKLLVDFSIQAYEDPETLDLESLGFELVKFIDNAETDTQGFIAKNDHQVVLAFRGTTSTKDKVTDMSVFKTDFPSFGFFKRLINFRSIFKSKTHIGFFEAYSSVVDEIMSSIERLNQSGDYEFLITGHSLGGALATIAALDFKMELGIDPVVYTYGAPKVGNKRFVRYYNRKVKNTFRVVNDEDPIPSVPGPSFKHVDNLALIDEKKSIKINPGFLDIFEKELESVINILNAQVMEEHASHHYKKLLETVNFP